jgi:hypothetical protein
MNEPNEIGRTESGRRTFIKRAAYIAPAVLTLSAVASFAKAGSVKEGAPPGPPGRPPGR